MSQFIVLEGLDGAGTTTQSELLHQFYGKKSFWDKEPTDSPIGKKIRGILKEHTPLPAKEILSLFIEDRKAHQIILQEQLKNGVKVILDRYLLSTMAYQGLEFDVSYLYTLNQDFLVPDVTFFLDIDPEISFARLSEKKELFEKLELQKQIRQKYFEAIDILQKVGWNIILLDGNDSIANLHNKIVQHLKE